MCLYFANKNERNKKTSYFYEVSVGVDPDLLAGNRRPPPIKDRDALN